jgi:two-component system, chemotaxis family, protein-glutamate methylesterase/glutaminase
LKESRQPERSASAASREASDAGVGPRGIDGRPIRVLVVDDSAFMRKVLVKMLEPYEDIEVVATAMDGVFALEKLERAKPDVVTLDLEMPRMDGRTALQRMVDDFQLPVILVSAHTSKGARATFEGLAAGAVDFVTKPERIFTTPLESLSTDLVQKIRAAAKAKVRRPPLRPPEKRALRAAAPKEAPATEVVAIAVSTGGPNALSLLLAQIRGDYRPGILIVQHMPEGFTGQFAERLSKLASIGVREAEDGDVVASGVALIAPGGKHMEIVRSGLSGKLVVRISFAPPVRGHRPSADVLFQSVAKNVGPRSIGMILTGMGEDGAEGLSAIRAVGGHTLAQDEASSVVYGMPRAAIERGAVDKVISLSEMGAYLNALEASHYPQGGPSWIA